MLCRLTSAAVLGIDAIPIEVEVDISGGLPGFHLVGLPMGAVREGSVRIKAALANSSYSLGCSRVTVNLAPADLRKEGAAFDLAIAIGSLVAKGLLKDVRKDLLLAGELSLDGRVRSIRGVLSLAELAARMGLKGMVLPAVNAAEAALVEGLEIYGVETLQQAVSVLAGGEGAVRPSDPTSVREENSGVDFAELVGQREARRAAEVAAAGGHNLMLVGPPGSGKTMIARRLGTILPPLTRIEAIEATKVHSVAGLLGERHLVPERPFRAPHHTCSHVGLVGGGAPPRPGEVSLAHHGVLFLDELPEFQRAALEALRQPLEDGQVTIVRARQSVTFPSRFMLVAAMNPCPCGYAGSTVRVCTCGEKEARRYRGRISGPLLDRFDLFISVGPVPTKALLGGEPGESSGAIRERVARARRRQAERFRRKRIHCNAQMSARQLGRHVALGTRSTALLTEYAEAHRVSARALHRTCRVARTIADLEDRDDVTEEHLLLALTLQQARWML
ncbi:MAG: YifB family Mg chelatase-like AAA ATPase [Deltaproteobacteria bacterium]|nr:YifB family Mg chelatase-like AAA ATPase [Deltaproteobacteria bacterium]